MSANSEQCDTGSARRGTVTVKVTAGDEHMSEGAPRVTGSDEYIVPIKRAVNTREWAHTSDK